jgi:hypothetical protein
MALAIMVGKVMLVVVMIETTYGWDAPADYPDLAGKANYSGSWCSTLGAQDSGRSAEHWRFAPSAGNG